MLRFIIIIRLFFENIQILFSITCFIALENVNKTTLALSVIAATALAFVIGPALMQSASAIPAPKTDERCDDIKFADRESCPGKTEDAKGDPRDDECVPRNRGHIDDCPDPDEVTEPVNPPSK